MLSAPVQLLLVALKVNQETWARTMRSKVNMSPSSKILGAVDPFDEPSRLQAPVRLLKDLVETGHSIVQPVYVVSVAGMSSGMERSAA